MRKLAIVVVFNGLLFAGISSAALVDFTTAGSLACAGAANCLLSAGSLVFGTVGAPQLQISYSANVENDLNVTPTASTNFGTLSLTCILCNGATASFNIAGATLAIGINQGADPFNQNGNAFNGTFSGTMSVTAGNLGGSGAISFGTTPIQAVFSSGPLAVIYTMQQPEPPPVVGYILSTGNPTSLQGVVTTELSDEPVPEPATFGMLGLGVAGLFFFRRR